MNLRLPHLLGCAVLAVSPFYVRGADPAATPAPAAPAATADSRLDIPASDAGLPGAGPIRRQDWFRAIWSARRRQFAADTPKDQGALVFLGDSITQGWGDVGSSFPGLKIANRGISGDTSRGVLIRLQEDVIALHPAGVVLLIGTNDIADKATPEQIAGNLRLIVAALHDQNPAMPVILCAVFPSAASKDRPAETVRKLNSLYLETVADQPQVAVLDTFAVFVNSHGEAKDEEMPDLLHPNLLGYAKWARALRPLLEETGLAPAWPDDFVTERGYTSLFNGRDLTGWRYEGGPDFGAGTATPDGRYLVRNGRLVVTTARKGGKYLKLWTTSRYPRDFTLKLEFRASPNADSGIFVREPQLQCRDFLAAGPYVTLAHYHPQDWNEIVVTVRGSLAHCTCNGEVIEDAMPVPADGAIGLESDHGQMEYRRIRVAEAP